MEEIERSIYLEAIRAAAPPNINALPPVVLNSAIEECLKPDFEIKPAPPGSHNISHAEKLQLVHDIVIFTTVAYLSYKDIRGDLEKLKKKSDQIKLTAEQKKEIKKIVDKRLKEIKNKK